jgi:malic enzyme
VFGICYPGLFPCLIDIKASVLNSIMSPAAARALGVSNSLYICISSVSLIANVSVIHVSMSIMLR